MRIKRDYEVWRACADDDTRPALCHVNVIEHPEYGPVAVAADGFMLAVVPVELDEGDVLGLVSGKALAQAAKLQPKRKDEPLRLALLKDEIEVVGKLGVSRLPRLVDGASEYTVFPSLDNFLFFRSQPFAAIPHIAMDPKLIENANKAIGGSEGLSFNFHGTTSGPVSIGPRGNTYEGVPFALVMPMYFKPPAEDRIQQPAVTAAEAEAKQEEVAV